MRTIPLSKAQLQAKANASQSIEMWQTHVTQQVPIVSWMDTYHVPLLVQVDHVTARICTVSQHARIGIGKIGSLHKEWLSSMKQQMARQHQGRNTETMKSAICSHLSMCYVRVSCGGWDVSNETLQQLQGSSERRVGTGCCAVRTQLLVIRLPRQ